MGRSAAGRWWATGVALAIALAAVSGALALAGGSASGAGPHGLSATEIAANGELVSGRYIGAGVTLAADRAGQVAVSEVSTGSPAAASGLRIGDVLERVADDDVSGSATSQVAGLLRGSSRSSVSVVVRRGTDRLHVDLHRAPVPTDDVAVRDLRGGVRLIRIDRFSAGVAGDVSIALSQGPAPAGVVLDLRDNPGGLVTQAVAVASLFLTPGPVAVLDPVDPVDSSVPVGADAQPQVLRTSSSPLTFAPMVVLVDAGSASAAELLTGALQDRGRAVVVGARTYGKGTIQLVDGNADGTGTITTQALYRTPDGHDVNGIGLTPDVLLQDPVADANAFDSARTILTGMG